MRDLTPTEKYANEIYLHLIDGFNRDNEDQKWEVEDIDATAWFTGLVMASGMLFNKLTDEDKNFIEFTHLSQNLLIQNMVEKIKAS